MNDEWGINLGISKFIKNLVNQNLKLNLWKNILTNTTHYVKKR
jgi:hypothetical protein